MKRALPVRIKRFRVALGWSQTLLAHHAQVAVSTICELEGGQLRDVNASTLLKIAVALEVSLNALLGYDSHLNQVEHLRRGTIGPFVISLTDHTKNTERYSCMLCAALVAPGDPHHISRCADVLRIKGCSADHLDAILLLSSRAGTVQGLK